MRALRCAAAGSGNRAGTGTGSDRDGGLTGDRDRDFKAAGNTIFPLTYLMPLCCSVRQQNSSKMRCPCAAPSESDVYFMLPFHSNHPVDVEDVNRFPAVKRFLKVDKMVLMKTDYTCFE